MNKKGDGHPFWMIVSIILAVIVLSLFIEPIKLQAQELLGLKETAVNPYQACHGKEDGDVCALKSYSGICNDGMCVKEDLAAYSLEEATQLFQTTFKKNLELCKQGTGSGCDDATKNIDNILSYIDAYGDSQVDILVVKYGEERSDFILRKNKKILLVFPGGRAAYVSFRFEGNTCFMKGSNIMSGNEWNKAGIRRGSNGLQVFITSNEGATRGEGNFLAIQRSANGVCMTFQ